MKRHLCYDCAFALGYAIEWWNNEEYVDDCANQKSGEGKHGTVAVLINTSVPARKTSAVQMMELKTPSAADLLDPDDIAI